MSGRIAGRPRFHAFKHMISTSADQAPVRSQYQEDVEYPIMQSVAKLLILLGFAATVSGCVVAPYGPRPRAYVAAPVVVVHPGYYGPRYYYYGPR